MLAKNRCPATDHAHVTMTARGFKELCQAKRSGEYCDQVCMGEIYPPNLIIAEVGQILAGKPQHKESNMPQQKGTCDSCKEKDMTLKPRGELNLCGKCSTIFSNVRNWLPQVEMALANEWPNKYGLEVLAVAGLVPPDQSTLADIAGIVGYQGPMSDERGLVTQVNHLVGQLRADNARLASEGTVLAEQLREAERLAAYHEQRSGEDRCQQCDDVAAMDVIIALLGLERDATHADAVQGVRELQSKCARLEMFERKWNENREGSLDSHLLDLLIEHPAIGVERIAVLREAA